MPLTFVGIGTAVTAEIDAAGPATVGLFDFGSVPFAAPSFSVGDILVIYIVGTARELGGIGDVDTPSGWIVAHNWSYTTAGGSGTSTRTGQLWIRTADGTSADTPLVTATRTDTGGTGEWLLYESAAMASFTGGTFGAITSGHLSNGVGLFPPALTTAGTVTVGDDTLLLSAAFSSDDRHLPELQVAEGFTSIWEHDVDRDRYAADLAFTDITSPTDAAFATPSGARTIAVLEGTYAGIWFKPDSATTILWLQDFSFAQSGELLRVAGEWREYPGGPLMSVITYPAPHVWGWTGSAWTPVTDPGETANQKPAGLAYRIVTAGTHDLPQWLHPQGNGTTVNTAVWAALTYTPTPVGGGIRLGKLGIGQLVGLS